MPKKFLTGLLLVIVALGLGGYWFYGQQQADGPAIMALPPAQALGFLALPGLPQAWTDLRQSKFFQHAASPAFWQRALGAEGYQRVVAERERIEHRLGLSITEDTVSLLLGRELGVAIVPGQRTDWPVDVILYVRVSGTEKIAESLARTFSAAMQDLVRETQIVDDIEIVTLRAKNEPFSMSYAFIGTVAVLSTDVAWVIDAIKARHGTSPDRLYASSPLQAMQLATVESPLAYAYYDVERLQAQAMAGAPATIPMPPAALQMLQTTGKTTLKARRTGDGIMVETMAWYPPHGAPQVFRQVERDGAMPPFRGVPAETFYLTHLDLLDLQGVWRLLTQLAALGYEDGLQQVLTRFRAWAGVDLERDVLSLFTGVAGLGITAPLGGPGAGLIALPGAFLTLGLTDEAKGQQLIQTIGTKAGGPLFSEFLRRQPHDGHTIHYLGHPLLFVKPAYVISRRQLIVGSDVRLLQHMLDGAAGKTQTLSDTHAYQNVRKHFRITGGSITFVDVGTAVEKALEAWLRFGTLIQALTRANPGGLSAGGIAGDPWALAEMLRPIRYIGVASQAEAQGMRIEAFVAIQDLH
ncbi:MAG TPA: DUF3352 domain-containing protein [Candidatus Tectomicrobia bacterium]|nr:DUF3352 domain-containing protein [Candidatus Tectomicrobia bacterium]